MKITPDTIGHLARLAHLTLTEEERVEMAAHLERVMDQMAVLACFEGPDTEGEPPVCGVFREDSPAPSTDREELLKNAPAHDGESFLVPRTVG